MRTLQLLTLALLAMPAWADNIYDYTITAPLVTDAGDWDTGSSWQISFEVDTAGFYSSADPMTYGLEATDILFSQAPIAGDTLYAFVLGCAAASPWGEGGCYVGGGVLAVAWSSPTLGYDLAINFAGAGNVDEDTFWTTPGLQAVGADMYFESNAGVLCPAGDCTVLISQGADPDPDPVPEPAALTLLGTAAVVMLLRRPWKGATPHGDRTSVA
jgi:hypothetical protein